MRKYESKISLTLLQIILIITGIWLFLDFLSRFLSSKSRLDLFFFLPMVFILLGIFINEINLSKRFFIACFGIILFQGVLWVLCYFFSFLELTIEFYAQLASFIIFILILLVEYVINRNKLI